MKIIYPQGYEERDILICDFVVTDSRGKKRRDKSLFCKPDEDFDIKVVLRKLKLKTAKSIEIIPIKKIGTKSVDLG